MHRLLTVSPNNYKKYSSPKTKKAVHKKQTENNKIKKRKKKNPKTNTIKKKRWRIMLLHCFTWSLIWVEWKCQCLLIFVFHSLKENIYFNKITDVYSNMTRFFLCTVSMNLRNFWLSGKWIIFLASVSWNIILYWQKPMELILYNRLL